MNEKDQKLKNVKKKKKMKKKNLKKKKETHFTLRSTQVVKKKCITMPDFDKTDGERSTVVSDLDLIFSDKLIQLGKFKKKNKKVNG